MEQPPCVDGQMSTIIKIYRDWKITGNSEWLKENWGNIKKILEYAWSENNTNEWDRNKDGVLEGWQHHTLDVEIFGPTPWLQGLYLAALKAAKEMAEFLGKQGVCVRAGLHCAPLAHESAGTLQTGTVRVSFGHTACAGQTGNLLSSLEKYRNTTRKILDEM